MKCLNLQDCQAKTHNYMKRLKAKYYIKKIERKSTQAENNWILSNQKRKEGWRIIESAGKGGLKLQ